MSGKTRIVVLHMRELIYTGLFAALALLLIVLLVGMFRSGKKEETAPTGAYTAGVYTSPIHLKGKTMELKVVVDDERIQAVSLENMDDTVAAMYPLMQPTLDQISQQLYKKQSLDQVTYDQTDQYTARVLLGAIGEALAKAEKRE